MQLRQWKNLVVEMGKRNLMPDLFTVQQVNGAGGEREQLTRLVARMESELKGNYDFVIADPRPSKPQGVPTKGCAKKKKTRQRNREDRLVNPTTAARTERSALRPPSPTCATAGG